MEKKDIKIVNQIKYCIDSYKNTFFTTNNSKKIVSIASEYIQNELKEPVYIYTFQETNHNSPYSPLLDLISQYIDKENLSDILEKYVYYSYRELFFQYFNSLPIKSNYEFGLFNSDYERYEMYRSIINLIDYISKDNKIYLIIENLEYTNKSSHAIFEYILNKNISININNIFISNSNNSFMENFSDKSRSELLEKLNELFNNRNINFSNSGDNVYPNESDKINRKQLEYYIDLAGNYNSFLAFEDSKDMLLSIFNLKVDSIISTHYYAKLLNNLGDALYFLKEYNNALLYYNMFVKIKKYENYEEFTSMLGKLALTNFAKNNYLKAEKHIRHMLINIKSIDNQLLHLKASLINFIIRYRNNLRSPEGYFEDLKELILLAKQSNKINILYYTYLSRLTQFHLVDIEEAYNPAMKLIKKYKNLYVLSSLYHHKGTIANMRGKTKKGFIALEKSKKVRENIGVPLLLINIYNGIGYEYFRFKMYKESLDNYKLLLPMLKEVKDFNEVAITFYNISIVYFHAHDFKESAIWLEKVLSFTSELDMTSIPYHTIDSIYTLLGICYIKQKNILKAIHYLDQVKYTNKANSEEFYFYYFRGLFKKEVLKLDEAESYLKKSIELLKKSGLDDLWLPIIYLDYIEILHIKKNSSLVYKNIKELESLIKEKKWSAYNDIIKNVENSLGSDSIYEYKLPLGKIKYYSEILVEKAKQDLLLNKLYDKLDEENFFKNLQEELLHYDRNRDKIVHNIISVLHDLFFPKNLYLILKEDMSIFSHNNISTYEEDEIFKITKKYNLFNKKLLKDPKHPLDGVDQWENIVSSPLITNNLSLGVIIMLGNDNEFSSDDLEFLSKASKQITLGLLNIISKRKLELANKTILEQQKELTDKAYTKGLVEVNAGIIHNIGNIINVISLKLQVWLEDEETHSDKDLSFLENIVFPELKNETSTSLQREKIISIFPKFIDLIKNKREDSFDKLKFLYKKIEHVGEIISLQQDFIGRLGTENYYKLSTLVNEVAVLYDSSIKKHKITLKISLENDIEVLCDKIKLIQVIGNVVKNAIDELKDLDKNYKNITIYSIIDKNWSSIVIHDNGRGIPKESLNKIFEFGFSTKGVNGKGFGLHSCRELMHKYSGEISLESSLNNGTTFFIRFPKKYKKE